MTAEEIRYEEIRLFESRPAIEANIQINHPWLIENCPINDVKCYKIVLDDTDMPRVYILYGYEFWNITVNNSFKLSDITEFARTLPKARKLLNMNLVIDLSQSDNWSPVFICPDLNTGPLVPIDGNHRLMVHYLTHGSIQGIHAYLFVHTETTGFEWFPPS